MKVSVRAVMVPGTGEVGLSGRDAGRDRCGREGESELGADGVRIIWKAGRKEGRVEVAKGCRLSDFGGAGGRRRRRCKIVGRRECDLCCELRGGVRGHRRCCCGSRKLFGRDGSWCIDCWMMVRVWFRPSIAGRLPSSLVDLGVIECDEETGNT